MLCSKCPRTIWAISLGFCGNRPESSADKMYRACEQQDQNLKRLGTFYIFHKTKEPWTRAKMSEIITSHDVSIFGITCCGVGQPTSHRFKVREGFLIRWQTLAAREWAFLNINSLSNIAIQHYRSSQNYYRQSCYSWDFISPKIPLPLPSWNSDEFI